MLQKPVLRQPPVGLPSTDRWMHHSGRLECFSVVFGAREAGCCREIAAQFCDLHRQLMLYLWDGMPFRCLDSHTVAQHSHLAWRGKRVTPYLAPASLPPLLLPLPLPLPQNTPSGFWVYPHLLLLLTWFWLWRAGRNRRGRLLLNPAL